jgi:hypothetical protein
MKTLRRVCVLLILIYSAGLATDSNDPKSWDWGPCRFHDNINIDFEDGSLMAYDDVTDALLFEITPEYQLYVDGELVKTTHHQEDLLREYYHQAEHIMDEAKKIGFKGARIGVEGAKLAVTAVGGIFEMLFSGFDDSVIDEYERDVEMEAADLEAAAEILEEEAEVIEEMVDELDVMFEELQEEIPELGDLE